MRITKILASLLLVSLLTGCIGAVVGVAVDTTAAVIKAPFQLAGAVVGVAADTTGTVIAAPFRIAGAAVGAGHDHDDHHHSGRDHDHHEEHHR